MLRRFILGALVLVSCGPPARPHTTPAPSSRALAGLPSLADKDYDLADDPDLRAVRAQYDLLPPGDERRVKERRRLADELGRRMDGGLASDDRDRAYGALIELLGLWSPSELADPVAVAELARFAPAVDALRQSFARSGGDSEAALALAFGSLVDADGRDGYEAELEEIFDYADALAVAKYGEGAERARTIEILEHVASVLPAPAIIDRLIALYRERQIELLALLGKQTPSLTTWQAHDGVRRTVWNIARFSLRAGRVDDIPAAIDGLTGLGDAPDVRGAVDASLSAGATARDWMHLASTFVDSDETRTDLEAAFAACTEGARRFPDDPQLPRMAAAIAREDAHLPRAIFYTELAYRADPDDREIAEELAELYEFRVSNFALSDRPAAALARLTALEEFHAEAQAKWPKQPLSRDLADAYATMGRGLLSQGEVDRAEQYLDKSLALRDTYTALEQMGTIQLKRQGYAKAIAYFERALALPDGREHLFDRGRIRRLLAEALGAAGQLTRAQMQLQATLSGWHSALTGFELRPSDRAQLLTESGRVLWALGERDGAMAAFETAIDSDPDNENIYSDVISFLIVRNRYADALDAYHRALGSFGIGDYYKVYMSLWVLAEARRSGRSEDPNAVSYLRSREGLLWYDDLARFAVGATAFEPLYARANTRGRRAELYYYAALLDATPHDPARATRLLEDVLATDMLTFFEYDMARYILANGLIAKQGEMR